MRRLIGLLTVGFLCSGVASANPEDGSDGGARRRAGGIRACVRQVASLQAQVASFRTQVASLQAQVTSLQSQLGTCNGTANACESSLGACQTSLNNCGTSCSSSCSGASCAGLRAYRDARDFTGITSGDCYTVASWLYTNSTAWGYCPDATTTYSQATHIAWYDGNQFGAPSNAANTSFSGKLPATAANYNVWLYVAQTSRLQTFHVRNMTTGVELVVSAPITADMPAFSWLGMGVLGYRPDQILAVYTTNNDGYIQAFRGLYLTQGNETPIAVMTGQSGDTGNGL